MQQWWVKPLDAAADAGAAHGRVDRTGFSAILGPAPPVYDPGGPVLLADRVAADVELSVVEDEAAQMGAVLAVIPADPANDRERALHERGWTIASQWYLGQPR